MYKYTLTTIRADQSVPWYAKDPETEAYMQATYRDTNIMTSTVITESDLTDTMDIRVVTFISREAFYEFRSDPIVSAYLANRSIYEAENNIIRFKQEEA